ncbi:hypothetical protein [Uliginosibacterium sp. H1]|uniref:hypothetical protein n=1 Tax=Uliginosibacterium sp. H1 TaxID=3114757 RepID=UPI002E174A26|nr:hypothetical protein [Uliginosibacterium sp. H1]
MLAQAHAQEAPRVIGANVAGHADALLGLMAYTVTPDVTTSSLSINNGSTGSPGLAMTQFGGGFTISRTTPLYMEGNAAYARYDPRFVVTDGIQTRDLPTKWNSVTGTGGIGWDFRIADEWVLRPIFNFTLGYVSSDLSIAKWYIENRTNTQLNFLDDGHMSAGGLGGSLMLDWEQVRPDREIDLEIRYTNIRLKSFSENKAMEAYSTAQSLSIWSRWRAPTGATVMDRPLRYVLEGAYSDFLGGDVTELGFNRLVSLGVGIEFDSSAYDIIVTRTRMLIRHVMGDGVSGWSLGIAVSF